MNIKLAFASMDGTLIDQHFGSASYFQIYEIEGKAYTHVDTRKTAGSCRGNCEGGFDHFLEVLGDCDGIFVLKIGQGAAAFMISHGKRVFEATGSVENIIKEFILLDQP